MYVLTQSITTESCGAFEKGQEVQVIEHKDSSSKIRIDNRDFYVSNDLIEQNNAVQVADMKLFTLSPKLKRELKEKGVFCLFVEAFALIGSIAMCWMALVLIAELSRGV